MNLKNVVHVAQSQFNKKRCQRGKLLKEHHQNKQSTME